MDPSQTRKDPLYSTSQCLAEHSKDLPSEYRKLIKRAAHSDFALNALGRILFKDRVNESRVRTTQAIDVIQGGVKANALPEKATALINHRIAISRFVPKYLVVVTFFKLLSQQLCRRDSSARHDSCQAPREQVQFNIHCVWQRDFGGGCPVERDADFERCVWHCSRTCACHANWTRRSSV